MPSTRPWRDVRDALFGQRLQHRAAVWHRGRFPDAAVEHVALKAMSELGEVADALMADARVNAARVDGDDETDVVAEAADVVIALLVMLGRWYPHRNLFREVLTKLVVLETPGAHPSARLPPPAPQETP